MEYLLLHRCLFYSKDLFLSSNRHPYRVTRDGPRDAVKLRLKEKARTEAAHHPTSVLAIRNREACAPVASPVSPTGMETPHSGATFGGAATVIGAVPTYQKPRFLIQSSAERNS